MGRRTADPMTYAQLRRALSTVADAGDTAPTSALPVGRWLALKGAGCVVHCGGDRWALTRLGRHILSQDEMPRRKPKHIVRRTPATGHGVHFQQFHNSQHREEICNA